VIIETRSGFAGVGTRVLSVTGSGTPVVMFHGYADTADTWRGALVRLAAAGRSAAAVDLPGFGKADRRRPGELLRQFDDFADAVLDAFGPAVLVGNSLGSATAVRAAGRRPESVKALVALDDPLYAHHLPARLVRRREVPKAFWAATARVRVPTGALRWATAQGTRRVLYGPGRRPDPDVIAQWEQKLTSMADVARLGRYALQYAYETRAGHQGIQVRCPTVVVHGRRDRIIPVHSSRMLHQQIPGSEFVVLPKSGHCPQLDDPDEVARLVIGLLAGLDHRSQAT
jgi:pimeloyl-ACP methyl ester carboxylesterase